MRKRMIEISKGILAKEPNYVYYWLKFAIGISYGLISPIYAIFLFSRGLDAFQVGLTNLVFVLGNIVFQLPAGSLADTWGRKKTFLVSAIFNCLSFLIYAFGKRWLTFMLAEFFSAIGYVLMVGILEAWVVDAWKNKAKRDLLLEEEYGFLFSRAEVSGNLASMLGGLMGGLLAYISLQLPFLIGGIIFLFVLIMGYLLMEEDWLRVNFRIKSVIKQSLAIGISGTKDSFKSEKIWKVAIFSCLSMISFKILDIFWSKRFVDLFAGRVWITGYLWPLMTIFMILGNILLKKWIDKKKSYLWVFIIITIWASINIFLSTIFKNFYFASVFWLFYEISRGIQRPALFGYYNQIIPSNKRATILSFAITATWIGGAVGLLFLGWLAKKFSIEVSWLFASLIFLLSLIPLRGIMDTFHTRVTVKDNK